MAASTAGPLDVEAICKLPHELMLCVLEVCGAKGEAPLIVEKGKATRMGSLAWILSHQYWRHNQQEDPAMKWALCGFVPDMAAIEAAGSTPIDPTRVFRPLTPENRPGHPFFCEETQEWLPVLLLHITDTPPSALRPGGLQPQTSSSSSSAAVSSAALPKSTGKRAAASSRRSTLDLTVFSDDEHLPEAPPRRPKARASDSFSLDGRPVGHASTLDALTQPAPPLDDQAQPMEGIAFQPQTRKALSAKRKVDADTAALIQEEDAARVGTRPESSHDLPEMVLSPDATETLRIKELARQQQEDIAESIPETAITIESQSTNRYNVRSPRRRHPPIHLDLFEHDGPPPPPTVEQIRSREFETILYFLGRTSAKTHVESTGGQKFAQMFGMIVVTANHVAVAVRNNVAWVKPDHLQRVAMTMRGLPLFERRPSTSFAIDPLRCTRSSLTTPGR